MSDAPAPDRWDVVRVRRWLAQADALERQLAPVSEILFASAAIRPGERVLDVGCGTGPTTRRAASLVGPSGSVVGLDLAEEMLEAASAVPLTEPSAPIEWVPADVERWEPTGAPFDAVISRFGVMFFDDPHAAFSVLASATRAGGRLCVVTWDRRDRSPLFQVPFEVISAALRDASHEPADVPVDGGAYSLHDPVEVRALLGAAGWSDVDVAVHVVELRPGGGQGPDEAAESALGLGPGRILTADLDPELVTEVKGRLARELADRTDASGHVVLTGSVLRVTARRG